MKKSKSIAGITGPTLIVMVVSELRMWNPDLYSEQIIPLIYFSGVLFFIAGVSIVRSHNIWVTGWQTTLTVLGWLSILLGLARMFYPQVNKAQFKNGSYALFIEILLILLGIFLTYKAYFAKEK